MDYLRIPLIHRNFIHFFNYSLSYIENNIYNLFNNTDLVEIFPNLFISNYSSSTNYNLLKNLGIKEVLCINSFFNPPYPNDFEYHSFIAYDDFNENISIFFPEAINIIYMALSSKKKILVHCQAGRSRSASLILAFIIKFFTDSRYQYLPFTNLINQSENTVMFPYLAFWNEFIRKKQELELYADLCDIDYLNSIKKETEICKEWYQELVEGLIKVMQGIRPSIYPNYRFIEQIVAWCYENQFNILNPEIVKIIPK
jgi:hypothetical protein